MAQAGLSKSNVFAAPLYQFRSGYSVGRAGKHWHTHVALIYQSHASIQERSVWIPAVGLSGESCRGMWS